MNKQELEKYGKVEQAETIDGKFHLLISGFENTVKNINGCMEIVGQKYSKIVSANVDKGTFHLIMREN